MDNYDYEKTESLRKDIGDLRDKIEEKETETKQKAKKESDRIEEKSKHLSFLQREIQFFAIMGNSWHVGLIFAVMILILFSIEMLPLVVKLAFPFDEYEKRLDCRSDLYKIANLRKKKQLGWS
uniref:DUF4407 domain-containing protein n=1 Tax=Candidatus Kentrum sp. TC TaxID=2126339 RepID=A0A450ZF07_9GAMM|nr:MAG: protein of unknown function (DUF4407) [Candidatus Kentron sp. TC]